MKTVFESLKLFILDFASYLLALVRVSVVTPLEGDKASDARSIARESQKAVDAEDGEVVTAYGSLRRRNKHPGYVTSNGRGSLEVGRGR